MIASGNDFTDLIQALRSHTAAITSLVATLAPEVPDLCGTDYVANRIGCTKQWVAKMAERGDIPKDCIAPKPSGGRIWKFHRTAVDRWLSQEGHG